jgi:hypothetical protein
MCVWILCVFTTPSNPLFSREFSVICVILFTLSTKDERWGVARGAGGVSGAKESTNVSPAP